MESSPTSDRNTTYTSISSGYELESIAMTWTICFHSKSACSWEDLRAVQNYYIQGDLLGLRALLQRTKMHRVPTCLLCRCLGHYLLSIYIKLFSVLIATSLLPRRIKLVGNTPYKVYLKIYIVPEG